MTDIKIISKLKKKRNVFMKNSKISYYKQMNINRAFKIYFCFCRGNLNVQSNYFMTVFEQLSKASIKYEQAFKCFMKCVHIDFIVAL